LIDLENGGRRQAVGGDYVFCKCPERPQVIARYGRNWIIEDSGDVRQQATRTSATTPLVTYDEQFTLFDGAGKALPNTYYTVRLASGQIRHGVTDSQGLTARHETSDAQSIHIYIGHKQEA